MALLTTEELLEQVETAISTVLSSGQSYAIGDKRYTRADLAELHTMRRKLIDDYNSENSTRTRTNYASFQN